MSEMFWLNVATQLLSKKKDIHLEDAYVFLENKVDHNPDLLDQKPEDFINTL